MLWDVPYRSTLSRFRIPSMPVPGRDKTHHCLYESSVVGKDSWRLTGMLLNSEETSPHTYTPARQTPAWQDQISPLRDFWSVPSNLTVRKRNGSLEPVDPIQIVIKVAQFSKDLPHVNIKTLAEKAIRGLYDGVSTQELDNLLIQNAAMLIGDDPEYSKLAARLLDISIAKEVFIVRGIETFYDSITQGYKCGLIAQSTYQFVRDHALELNTAVSKKYSLNFEYFGLRTIYDRYLLRDPISRKVIETPQYFFMRVACGLSTTVEEAICFYRLIASFEYMPSTPTLFNSGTKHQQMSSCYLLDSPHDDLSSIYTRYRDVALLSKYAGGIGLSFSRVRSRGSLIRGTNGQSNGIVPFLKTLDSSVAAVNQGGKRKGAACIYLETWHADIIDFLQLRNNTGDEAQRTHNLNLANWIPDLFMKRVKNDEIWSLFDPKDTENLVNLYGAEFEEAYCNYENNKLFKSQIKARELYSLMMKTLAQTGNGWMTFKDASNIKSNQTGEPQNVIHLSNLCTEILEVTNFDETAVCNLGSINIGRYLDNKLNFDFKKLAENVEIAIKFLDRVIDINFYPIEGASSSNKKWRPVGLGLMGLQDLFFKLHLPFDSKEALALSTKIQETIYYFALKTSCDLAKKYGPHENFRETKASKGLFQQDLWNAIPENTHLPEINWNQLRQEITNFGLRNSLLIAIAPTATIASIVGAYECIEPQTSNLFKRETLSGEFLQVNSYLVNDLRKIGLWTPEIKNKIKFNDGSVQSIREIPDDLKTIYRTVWEIPQKSLIDLAAARGAYIDQSQSLNLFIENPTIGKLSSMYAYAWEKGLKTTYYLRSRSATAINKTTISQPSDSAAIACSLENPENCEACQ
jgi:ribonucleoside-diphosphate reductase alpha chain